MKDDTESPPREEMSLFGVKVSTIAFGLVLLFTCVLAMASAGKPNPEQQQLPPISVSPTDSVGGLKSSTSELLISQPPLPYSHDSLAPYISRETIDLHYGRHQSGYIMKLNSWLQANPRAVNLVRSAQARSASSVTVALVRSLPRHSSAYNLAAQIFNHALYFSTLARDSPLPRIEPTDPFIRSINAAFGSTDVFKDQFKTEALNHFGSGWVWLLINTSSQKPSDELSIVSTHDAYTPIEEDGTIVPLVVCDVWEHAYYVDYRNDRSRYVDAWFQATDWASVSRRFARRTIELPSAVATGSATYPQF